MSDQIKTVSDMMGALQKEIEEIKAGTITESQARVVSRFRALQLKTAELQLSYARLIKGRLPAPEMTLLAAAQPDTKA